MKVINYYLNKIKKRPVLLNCKNDSVKHFLTEVMLANPKMNSKKIFQYLGMKIAFEELGMRETRTVLSKFTDRTWYRLVKDTKSLKLPQKRDALEEISQKLDVYEPLRLVDYEDYLLNNDKNGIN